MALGSWLGRGDSVLTLVAAVIVAVTFQPMRTRLTRFADRVVYGKRSTPYEVLAELGERLGETYASRTCCRGSRACSARASARTTRPCGCASTGL